MRKTTVGALAPLVERYNSPRITAQRHSRPRHTAVGLTDIGLDKLSQQNAADLDRTAEWMAETGGPAPLR
jgi:hypothetical protein